MKPLSEKAMLVRMRCGRYQPYAYDSKATHQVEASNGVVQAGRFNKRLLKDSKYLAAANQAYTAIYIAHTKLTLPWLDEGVRILPSQMYFSYTEEMRALSAIARQRVDELSYHWGQEIERDQIRLGSLYREDDYPKDIRSRFYVETQFLPVPDAGDFRVDIGDEDKASLEMAVKEAEDKVRSHILTSLLAPLQHAVDKLSIPIGEDGSIFRDSLVENIVEIAERMEALDITEDPEVRTALIDVKYLAAQCANNISGLRNTQEIRTKVHKDVDAMVSNLKNIIG